MGSNENGRKRKKRTVKLSIGQRKCLQQHTHSREMKTNVVRKNLKRKRLNDVQDEDEVPNKIEVKDMSQIEEDTICDLRQAQEYADMVNESFHQNKCDAKEQAEINTVDESCNDLNCQESDMKSNSFRFEDNITPTTQLEAGNQNFPNYLNYALQALQDENVLKDLLIKLDSIDAVDDYILQARLLANGKLPIDNIPFLLSLERAKFAHVTTTTLMRFRPQTKAFWRVGYRTWHGKGMVLLSGSKNRGQVRSHYTKRGYYDPADASVNFAVPDVKTLFGSDCGIPKFINPGIIQESFDLIDKSKQYVLSYDLKKVGRGFKKDLGDENMWTFEGPPSLETSLKRIEDEKEEVEQLIKFCEEKKLLEMATKCKNLLHIIVTRIKEIREVEIGHRRLLAKLTDEKKKPQYKPDYMISFCKTQIFSCRNWIKSTLMCNREITQSLSMINGTMNFYQDVDRVDLNVQHNFDILLPPQLIRHIADVDNTPPIVKQRTAKWHELRKKARVTGSSCYNALGFGLMREAQEHFDTFVLKNPPKPIPADLQKILNYGTANEIHAVATLASVFMPALLPPCMQLVEDGCTFLDGDNIANLLEVSSDGIIECQHDFYGHGRPCQSNLGSNHYRRVVEIKCVYPKDPKDILSPVRYHIPEYHVTQLLCEMQANEAKEAWYVVYSEKSTVLIALKFSRRVWNQLWTAIKSTFDVDDPIRPTRVNKEINTLRAVLSTYAKTHSKVLAEVASMRAMPIGDLSSCTVTSPYRSVYSCTQPPVTFDTINESCEVVTNLTMPLLKEAHEIQRKRASEIFAFVLSDSDREYNKDMPANNPIAYALKGCSLDMDTARQMIEMVRNKCKEEGVNILSEVFDGQFANIGCRTIQGKPLTALRWQKENWAKLIGMSKDKLLRYVQDLSYVGLDDIHGLQDEQSSPLTRSIMHGNIQLDLKYILRGRTILRKYYLQSRGGPRYNFGGPTIKYVKTWKRRQYGIDPVWEYSMSTKKASTKKELTIDYVMELMACEEFPDALDIVQSMEPDPADESTNRETFDNLSQQEEQQKQPPKSILQEILVKLRNLKSKHDWKSVSITDFYVTKLESAQSIGDNFFSYEMDVIAQTLSSRTGTQILFNKTTDKITKINILSKFFGDQSVWDPPPQPTARRPNILLSLKKIALLEIEKKSYPKSVLACACAAVHHNIEFHKWQLSHNVPISANITCINRSIEFFSFPEFSNLRNEFENRTFDPTHILTNLRAHICRSGFQHVRGDAFKEVSARDNDLLSRAIVFECIDKQNRDIAMQVFCEEVEDDIRKHGDQKTADFVKLVRNWYLACDECGIAMATRLNWLIDMHDYMKQLYNPSIYPPPATHIYRLPVQTFEALMDSISTRIRLYSCAKGHKFNHRSVSSLGVESFFSDLTVVDISGSGCPKAYQIPKLISIITEYNTAKHNPAKIFNMDPRRGVKYPARLLDENSSSSEDEEQPQSLMNQFKSHSFDRIPRFTKKRTKFRVSVSAPTHSSRGEQPIRVVGKYKLNEATLKSCTRMGLPEDIDIQ